MKTIVGLGNPGEEYAATRHNVGFRVVERVASERGFGAFRPGAACRLAGGTLDGTAVRLVEPMTYMNRSGEVVGRLFDAVEDDAALRDLLVVTDDVHLSLGRMRFRAGGSCGGHNGLASVERALASRAYPRLRIGIGPAPDGTGAGDADEDEAEDGDLIDFVLGRFEAAEERILEEVLATAARAACDWVTRGTAACQNEYNGWRATEETSKATEDGA